MTSGGKAALTLGRLTGWRPARLAPIRLTGGAGGGVMGRTGPPVGCAGGGAGGRDMGVLAGARPTPGGGAGGRDMGAGPGAPLDTACAGAGGAGGGADGAAGFLGSLGGVPMLRAARLGSLPKGKSEGVRGVGIWVFLLKN